jgi:hypothetical protein
MVNGSPNISVKSEITKAVYSPAFRHSTRRRGNTKPSRKSVTMPVHIRTGRQCPYQRAKCGTLILLVAYGLVIALLFLWLRGAAG